MASLFEQIGGHDNLEKMVAQFYQFVLSDERINEFFLENVSDIPKLHSTMVQFLTWLFGGPNHYKGPDMKSLHKRMPIKPVHFDITWEHMESSFLIHKIPKDLISQLKAAVYSTSPDVIQIKE
jgi:hemoglobin